MIGDITSVFENAHDTCSTKPNQLLIPDKFFGFGKFLIDLSISLLGSIPSSVNSNPINSSFFLQNTNFSGFIMMPAFPVNDRYSHVLRKISSIVSPQMIESSTHLLLCSKSLVIKSKRWLYPSWAAKNPCGVVL